MGTEDVEQIMFIPRDRLDFLGALRGYIPCGTDLVERIIQPGWFYGPKPELERDLRAVQVVPYLVLTHGLRAWAYFRGKSGDEGRLHGKASIGIGGHINFQDADNLSWAYAALTTVGREAFEEIGMVPELVSQSPDGIIYRDDSDVSAVHLGLVYRATWEPCTPRIVPTDPAIIPLGWRTKATLAHELHVYEDWSQSLITHPDFRP